MYMCVKGREGALGRELCEGVLCVCVESMCVMGRKYEICVCEGRNVCECVCVYVCVCVNEKGVRMRVGGSVVYM